MDTFHVFLCCHLSPFGGSKIVTVSVSSEYNNVTYNGRYMHENVSELNVRLLLTPSNNQIVIFWIREPLEEAMLNNAVMCQEVCLRVVSDPLTRCEYR